MKKLSVLILLALSVILANAQKSDEEQIKNIIKTAYEEGLQNEGNEEKIELGFHKDFTMLGIGENGQMWKYPISMWKAEQLKKLEEGHLPLKDKDKVSVRFVSIDVTSNAAIVKLEYIVQDKVKYVDYMSLYKFDNQWKIVCKIFQSM